MAEYNIGSTIISSMKTAVPDYQVPALHTDAATGQDETEYMNSRAPIQLGYYKTIPELKKAIDLYAIWTIGKGYTADPETTVILDHIIGWGEDTFHSILWNMLVCKKVYGDAFAEIMRDKETGTVINLKVLDPNSIKIILNSKGIIKRYEQVNKLHTKTNIKFEPNEILHFSNDRIADEIHGVSVIDACKFVIDARNEAMSDWKTVLHRNINPLKIVYVDTDDPVKIEAHKTLWEKITKDKEVIFVPKGSSEVVIPPVQLQDPFPTIKYYENFFYQAVGVPKVITGGSEEFTESSSKIAYLSFEQTYSWDGLSLEADIWNQLQLRIKFNKPVSLKNELLSDEGKDTGQLNPPTNQAGVEE